MKKDLKKVKKCPACGSENVRYREDDNMIVCNDCGEIFGELTPEDEKKYEDASDEI